MQLRSLVIAVCALHVIPMGSFADVYRADPDAPGYTIDLLCDQVQDSVDRRDCEIGEAAVVPNQLVPRPNSYLSDACESAYTSFSMGNVLRCQVGLERFRDEVYTSFASILERSGSCQAFIAQLNTRIESVFGIEAGYWRTRFGAAVANDHNCNTFNRLADQRGVRFGAEGCGSGDSRGEALGPCVGVASDQPRFRDLWMSAADDCRSGAQIEIRGTVRETLIEAGSDLYPYLDCRDVVDVLRSYSLTNDTDLEAIEIRERDSWGNRPPRDSDAINAMLAAFGTALNCDAVRLRYCDFPLYDPSQLNTVQAVDEVMRQVTQAHRDAMAAIGVDAVRDELRGSLRLRLAIVDVRVLQCTGDDAGAYVCRVFLTVDCRVDGPITFEGLDLYRGTLEASLCPRLGIPLGSFERGFQWRGGMVEVSTPGLPWL